MRDINNDTPELAQAYDRVSDSQYESGLKLIGMMGIHEGEHVLDVGCGTGRLALYVSGVVGASGSVAGLDPSPHRIQVSSEKPGGRTIGNLTFTQGCAEDLRRFPDAGFDAVYYNAVFHWIGDKKAALGEAYRVLKTRGTIGLTTGCRDGRSTMGEARLAAFRQHPRWQEWRARHVIMWLTKDEMASLLTEAGFTDVTVEQKTAVKYYQSPEEYFCWLRASSPGRQSRAPEHVRSEVRRLMAEELERRRTPRGIEVLSSHMIAIARRP